MAGVGQHVLSLFGMGGARRASATHKSAAAATNHSINHSGGGTLGSDRDGPPRLRVMEGWMHKEGGVFKTWKRRLFKLSGVTLAYYTEEGAIKGVIPLHNALLRSSTRKGLEHGFELVLNPSPATRDAGIVFSASGAGGELSFVAPPAVAAISASQSANSSSSASASSTASASSPSSSSSSDPHANSSSHGGEERVYYMYVSSDDDVDPASRRDEWMSALRDAMEYPRRLAQWASGRDETHAAELGAIKRQLDTLRAEREMERLERESEQAERRAQERAAMEALAQAERAREEAELAAQRDDREADASLASSTRGRSESSVAAEAAVAAQRAHDRAIDSALLSGALSSAEFVAAFKAKNARLEEQVRMLVTENERLRSVHEADIKTQVTQLIDAEREKMREEARVEARKEMEREMRAREVAAASAAAAIVANTASISPASSVTAALLIPSPVASPRSTSPDLYRAASTSPPPTLSLDMQPRDAATAAASSSNAATPASAAAATSTHSPHSAASPSSSTSSSGALVAPVPTAGHLPLTLGDEKCQCTCAPPCVPFPAHKHALSQLLSLEGRLASCQLEKSTAEAHAAKYRAEKKLLKTEVLRLRGVIAQQSGNAAASQTPTAAR